MTSVPLFAFFFMRLIASKTSLLFKLERHSFVIDGIGDVDGVIWIKRSGNSIEFGLKQNIPKICLKK